ncbi:MAG TPA: trypsin-like peptidase domain-containing protein [Acidimicrobiales bacterium]|jgi:S1-C subfamily serine protease|nr:trypsin-like peptidase domain-containing protein [Acidimicrobiales bacterium]
MPDLDDRLAVEPPGEPPLPDDSEALDAYSRTVTTVAQRLLPSVASLRHGRGNGSAVILSGDGLLLTSAHVVASGRVGSAVFHDGAELPYEVVGADRLSDLAVVRVATSDLPAAELGDAARLRVGQLVVAVGSPLGYAGSVSAGVVSAVGRSLPAIDGRRARIVEGVIQTDAALHPGNSGGALATGDARVVGINTAVVGPGIGQGLGMAIPLDATTNGIIGALIAHGRVHRAELGLSGGSRALPPRMAERLGRRRGVEVTGVVTGGPAARAGMRPEDIVVALGGHPVEVISDMQRLLTGEVAGHTLDAEVVRGGDLLKLPVVPRSL